MSNSSRRSISRVVQHPTSCRLMAACSTTTLLKVIFTYHLQTPVIPDRWRFTSLSEGDRLRGDLDSRVPISSCLAPKGWLFFTPPDWETIFDPLHDPLLDWPFGRPDPPVPDRYGERR